MTRFKEGNSTTEVGAIKKEKRYEMNKQELIEKLKEEKEKNHVRCVVANPAAIEVNNTFYQVDKALETAINYAEKLDEPQKVKVKQFVAEWYEEHKHNLSNSLWEFTAELNEKTLVTGAIYTEFESWFIDHPRAYEVITSMENGYEVEEEPLYTVTINLDRKYHLVLDEGDGDDEISTTLTTRHGVLGYRYFLTEKEIKSIDERYWPFAVPVEKV